MGKYCRICGQTYSILEPILNNKELIKKIHTVLQISVLESDEFPTTICNSCKEIILCMSEFHDHVRKTQMEYIVPNNLKSRTRNINVEIAQCRLCKCSYEDFSDLMNDHDTVAITAKLFKITFTEQNLPTIICKPCKDAVDYNWNLYVNVRRDQSILFDKINKDAEDEEEDDDDELNIEIISDALTGILRTNDLAEDTNSEDDFVKKIFLEDIDAIDTNIHTDVRESSDDSETDTECEDNGNSIQSEGTIVYINDELDRFRYTQTIEIGFGGTVVCRAMKST